MRHTLHTTALLLALLTMAACSDDATDMGATLIDGSTVYDGKEYTMTVDTAYSLRDDSLLTTGNSQIIIGNYADPLFGKVSASFFTQITLPNATTSVSMSAVEIDSVVLTLVPEGLFPDTAQSYTLRFEVVQLAEAIDGSKQYYATDSIAVDAGAVLYDGTLTVSAATDSINLRLGGPINNILRTTGERDEFAAATKGLRISIAAAGSDNGMVTFALSDTRTRMRTYYHYGTDTTHYDFSISNGKHFTHFVHDYAGTALDGQNSVDGASRLYLDPLGGFNAVVGFGRSLQAFHEQHPLAVIHRAELLLPVAAEAPARHPQRLIATNGTRYINDYALAGVDGYYDSDSNRYRLRMPLHVQNLLRTGHDGGTHLLIDTRGSTAERTLLNGYNESETIKIKLIYTE